MESMGEVIDKVSGFVRLVGERLGLRENVAVGMRRVSALKKDYERRGFSVVVNSNVNKGVDLVCYGVSGGRPLVEAIESTNWASPKEYMKEDRFVRYVQSLNEYDALPFMYIVKKKIVVSYLENLRPEMNMDKQALEARLAKCEKNRIEVIVVGHQD